VSAQHLRPLFAFVVVAIVAGVVFGNALRAQDVVDAIRGGASNVLAGTPLMHEPLYVVEEGQRLDAAEVPEPQATPSADAGPSTVSPIDETASSADVSSPAPTPADGGGSGTQSTGVGAQGGGGQASGQVGGTTPGGAPKAPATGNAPGPGNPSGHGGSSGPGGAAVGHETNGHGDDNGHHKAKGHVRPARGVGHDGDHGRGHDKADHGKAKGQDRSGHGEAKGHAKSKDHGHR
jgi:hypothetical protein